jgi:hypothetical protein
VKPKDQWIERYGGFRIGESDEQVRARMARIDELLEKQDRTPADERELTLLRGPGLPDR